MLINVILFLITLFTTTLAGALQRGVNPLLDPSMFYKGLPFSITLMLILLSHELGHYYFSKFHRIDSSLPYFIPAPSLIGTFGAFIKMRSPVRDRRALLDVGAAGPLAGFIIALPALIIGLLFSEVVPKESPLGAREYKTGLGSSLLVTLLSKIFLGDLPEGVDVIIHPIGFAGWIGLLVTALNLLPIGQLDGGHICYAFFGEWHKLISRVVFLSLLAFGFFWQGWFMWSAFLILMGLNHPPPMDPFTPLDRKRKVIAWIALILFIFIFIPVPFYFYG